MTFIELGTNDFPDTLVDADFGLLLLGDQLIASFDLAVDI
jgi:hypothetical protein